VALNYFDDSALGKSMPGSTAGVSVGSAANFIGVLLDPQGRERAPDHSGVSADVDRRAAEFGGGADD
jgi:hypothetical protein